MKRIVYILMATMLLAVGCSKKEKKYLPFSGLGGDASSSTTASSGSGAGTNAGTSVTGASLTQITVSPASQSIARNTHANYTATGVYSDGTIKTITNDVTWSVQSETDKASTVDSVKGRYLGTAATTSGSPATIKATYESVSGTANLSVTSATLSSIQVTSVPSLTPGGTVTYIATGVFSDGTTQDISSLVTWSSSNTSSVSINATTGAGTGGNSAGSATIIATLISPSTFPTVANNGVATTTTILRNATIVSITVTGVSSIGAGATTSYVASAIYSDGTSSDITTQATWSVNSSANASVSDASGSKGVLTTISAGTVNVQATYSGVTGTKAVTITSVSISSIAVTPNTKTIAKDTTAQFTATATYSDNSTADISKSAVWSSSNTAAATVSTSTSTGGAAQGIGAGATTITATSGGKSGTATLTVTSATLTSIAITGSDPDGSIAKGTTNTYTATGTFSDNSTQDITSLVTWTSSSIANASISNVTGTKGIATAINVGNSTIQASLNGVNSNTLNLAVTAATLTSISIDASGSVENGSTKQFTATGTFSDGTTQNITSLVTWSSSTPANASISNAVSDIGKAYGLTVGTTNITASLVNGTNGIATTGGGTISSAASVLTITAPATANTSNSTVAGYNVTVPSGMTTVTSPTGDFSGITYQGNPAQVAGFVSTVQYTGTAGCTNFGATLLSAMINDNADKITANNQISSNTIGTNPDCSVSYNLAVTVNTNMTVTELSNHLIQQIGRSVPNGTISNLPVNAGSEQPTTTFRVILQATYSSTGNELVGVGVSRESDYASNAALLNSLLDGTNINPSGSTNVAKTDSFTATADPKVDFVWVVDNSGSMSGEQLAVSNNSLTFFNKLNDKHLDFRLGVIATGSTGSNNSTLNPGGNKAWELWGTSQDGSKWVYKNDTNASTTFKANVDSTTINGSGVESGIFFAQRALGGGPSPVTATITPRTGAKLIFVILTDEGDNYQCYTGGSYPGGQSNQNPTCTGGTAFNTADNIFTQNQYKVYAVIGLHDGSLTNTGVNIGQAGKCDSNPASSTAPKAENNNNAYPLTYDLAIATGGSVGSICASDYTNLLDNIATQAAGNASSYVLTKTPVSSTIVVKVNGTTVAQDATNGWQYNANNKTIVFSGTAWPTEGAAISVSYQYNSSANVAFGKLSDSKLMAYISKTAKSGTARGAAAAIAILAGAILAGRIWRNSKKNK